MLGDVLKFLKLLVSNYFMLRKASKIARSGERISRIKNVYYVDIQ